jgi:hypothetical protein
MLLKEQYIIFRARYRVKLSTAVYREENGSAKAIPF